MGLDKSSPVKNNLTELDGHTVQLTKQFPVTSSKIKSGNITQVSHKVILCGAASLKGNLMKQGEKQGHLCGGL